MKYLKLVRFQNLVAMALIQYLIRYSLLIPAYGENVVLGDLVFGLLVFSMLLIAAGGYVINDYFDIQVDTVNNKVLVGRNIKRRVALILHVLFTFTGVVLGFYIAYSVGYTIIGAILPITAYTLWMYSLKLKRKLFIGNFIIAKLSSVFTIFLALFELAANIYHIGTPRLVALLCVYALFAFICSLMHEVIKDMKGSIGDKTFNIKTLATEWGVTKTKEFLKWLSISLAFMVILVSFYEFSDNLLALTYAATAIVSPLFLVNYWIYKAQNKDDYSKISKLNKFIIFTGILSLCFFI
jgi:4-hydroxybenzoate polyprenyltransferase